MKYCYETNDYKAVTYKEKGWDLCPQTNHPKIKKSELTDLHVDEDQVPSQVVIEMPDEEKHEESEESCRA